MAATATARSTAPARRAPARKRAAPRRRQHTPAAGFVPVALRTAGAVGGIADSGVVLRLTRGRLWIGMLAALLVGIVALNVIALSFNASSSDAARQADVLNRQNSAFRAQIAELTASAQVQQTAGRLGLHVPNPDQIGYLKPGADDAVTAAKRLRDGDLTAAAYVPPVYPAVAAPTDTAAAVGDPAATDPAATDPAVADPATATETAPATETVTPAEPAATDPAASGGGVSSP
jgi:hypothetical protein